MNKKYYFNALNSINAEFTLLNSIFYFILFLNDGNAYQIIQSKEQEARYLFGEETRKHTQIVFEYFANGFSYESDLSDLSNINLENELNSIMGDTNDESISANFCSGVRRSIK